MYNLTLGLLDSAILSRLLREEMARLESHLMNPHLSQSERDMAEENFILVKAMLNNMYRS